jgi:hypothetical protein
MIFFKTSTWNARAAAAIAHIQIAERSDALLCLRYVAANISNGTFLMMSFSRRAADAT